MANPVKSGSMTPMRRVIPIFALLLVVAIAKAVPPPRLAKGPAPVPVPNIALAKQLTGRFIPPQNGLRGIPGTVTIPSKNPRRAIMEEHLLTRSGETFRGKFLRYCGGIEMVASGFPAKSDPFSAQPGETAELQGGPASQSCEASQLPDRAL